MAWLDLLIIGGFVILALIVGFLEIKDIQCPLALENPGWQGCTDGGGKIYTRCRCLPSDTATVSLNKLDLAAVTLTQKIDWRVSFIVATLISLLLTIAFGEWKWKRFLLTFVLAYLVIFSFANYYNYHHYRFIQENIQENVNNLRLKAST